MADNVALTGVNVATDKVSYSGDTVDVQLNEVVHVEGAEGARTVTKLTDLTGLNVHTQPSTSGGYSRHHVVASSGTNAANVKASAGQIFAIHLFNNAADGLPKKLALHNTAGAPTAGTGVVESYICAAGQHRDIYFKDGKPFSTGIARTIVAVGTVTADADAVAVAAGDLTVDIDYI